MTGAGKTLHYQPCGVGPTLSFNWSNPTRIGTEAVVTPGSDTPVGVTSHADHLMEWISFPDHAPVTIRQAPARRSPHFPEKKGSVFRALQEPPLFRAIAVIRQGQSLGMDENLPFFCAFWRAAKKAGFFPIKTGIFRKGRF